MTEAQGEGEHARLTNGDSETGISEVPHRTCLGLICLGSNKSNESKKSKYECLRSTRKHHRLAEPEWNLCEMTVSF